MWRSSAATINRPDLTPQQLAALLMLSRRKPVNKLGKPRKSDLPKLQTRVWNALQNKGCIDARGNITERGIRALVRYLGPVALPGES